MGGRPRSHQDTSMGQRPIFFDYFDWKEGIMIATPYINQMPNHGSKINPCQWKHFNKLRFTGPQNYNVHLGRTNFWVTKDVWTLEGVGGSARYFNLTGLWRNLQECTSQEYLPLHVTAYFSFSTMNRNVNLPVHSWIMQGVVVTFYQQARNSRDQIILIESDE